MALEPAAPSRCSQDDGQRRLAETRRPVEQPWSRALSRCRASLTRPSTQALHRLALADVLVQALGTQRARSNGRVVAPPSAVRSSRQVRSSSRGSSPHRKSAGRHDDLGGRGRSPRQGLGRVDIRPPRQRVADRLVGLAGLEVPSAATRMSRTSARTSSLTSSARWLRHVRAREERVLRHPALAAGRRCCGTSGARSRAAGGESARPSDDRVRDVGDRRHCARARRRGPTSFTVMSRSKNSRSRSAGEADQDGPGLIARARGSRSPARAPAALGPVAGRRGLSSPGRRRAAGRPRNPRRTHSRITRPSTSSSQPAPERGDHRPPSARGRDERPV